MREVHEDIDYAGFDSPKGVVRKEYCLKTGLLATPDCAETKVGYYKVKSSIGLCDAEHVPEEEELPGEEEEGGETTTTTTPTTNEQTTTTTTTPSDGNGEAA